MPHRFTVAALAALISVVLASCGGATAPTSNLIACSSGTGTLVAPPTLVSPAAGAAGVPDGNFTLTMTWTQSPTVLPWFFSLQPQSGTVVALTSFTTGATVGSTTTYTSAIPALAAKTTYTMTMSATINNCPASQTFGSFTTQ